MIHVRDAVLGDLPAMLDIYNDAIRNLTATFDLEEQNLDERKTWFAKYDDKYPLVIAELDGCVVGYCCLNPFRDKPAYAHSTELSVYIAPNYRGRKIGSRLMTEILQRAEQLGYHTVIGGVAGGNLVSMKLHEKFGFTYVGCFKEVGLKFGEWQDVHFYQLMFNQQS